VKRYRTYVPYYTFILADFQEKVNLKREPAELIVIEHPVEENKKILDIADYDGDYDDEDYDYVDFTAEEERMAAQQGRVKGRGFNH
jgi:hypothetical protein